MNDPYDLLIGHAAAWAAKTKRPLDADLLGTALSIRDTQDRIPGTAWPAGSADYLMTTRWPGHGPLGVPDIESLVATLDTFWRFLRATGRMASGSADPKDLTREARRAIPTMRERCGDPGAFGAAKSMQAYAEEIGISLDGADSIEELNARLQQVQDSWNALSIQERRERAPGPPGAGSVASRELSEFANALLSGADLGAYAGPMAGRRVVDEEDDDEALPMQDHAVVAAQLRASGFVRLVLRLVEWVGPQGRAATKTGVLRPAYAREAIAALDLDEWTRSVLGQEPGGWRSAGEHSGLDRLFLAAVSADLLEVRGTKVVVGRPWPEDPRDQVMAGMLLLAGVRRRAEWDGTLKPLLGLMLGMIFGEFTTVSSARQWWRRAPANVWKADPGSPDEDSPELADLFRRQSDEGFDKTVAFWSDTGLWRAQRGKIRATELGIDFTRVLVRLEELDEDDDE
ncbi:MAG: hypothetical protein U0Q21_16755 [Dermatophilaceae bacterium]